LKKLSQKCQNCSE